jgi:hypothetical protein
VLRLPKRDSKLSREAGSTSERERGVKQVNEMTINDMVKLIEESEREEESGGDERV